MANNFISIFLSLFLCYWSFLMLQLNYSRNSLYEVLNVVDLNQKYVRDYTFVQFHGPFSRPLVTLCK